MDISVKNCDRNIKKSKIDSIFNFKHIFKQMKIDVKKYFLCTIIYNLTFLIIMCSTTVESNQNTGFEENNK